MPSSEHIGTRKRSPDLQGPFCREAKASPRAAREGQSACQRGWTRVSPRPPPAVTAILNINLIALTTLPVAIQLGLASAAYGQTSTTSEGFTPEKMVIRGARPKQETVAEASTNIDFRVFDLEAADLGQLLSRQQGIAVRRTGGLGSDIRFSLNGLTGNQIRFFVDGVPLRLAGLGEGIADVPPSLVETVTIYRGVVPARLGADALGGAIELRTATEVLVPEVNANYLFGSFGTHRVSASASLPLNNDGLFVRALGFFDRTDNDYESLHDVASFSTGPLNEGRFGGFTIARANIFAIDRVR